MTTYLLSSSGNYTARQLIYAVKHAKSAPSDTRYLVGEWSHPMTPAEYLKWFRRKLNEKINTNGDRTLRQEQSLGLESVLVKGRKLSSEYQLSLRRDAARLSGCGGLGRQLETPEVRKRLDATHVHFYINGKHLACGYLHCESI